MARKERYSKRVFANIKVSSVKKGGGVEYLKRYIYCRSIWRFNPSEDKVFSFFIQKDSLTFL
jgi:hypothetical protein